MGDWLLPPLQLGSCLLHLQVESEPGLGVGVGVRVQGRSLAHRESTSDPTLWSPQRREEQNVTGSPP